MRGRVLVLGAAFALTACIPRGGDDHGIKTSSDVANPENAVPEPVPEQAIVIQTPSWNPASIERNARQVATSVYIVRPGDSLLAIASNTGAGATAIAIANDLLAPYTIRAGDRLHIPGGLYHKVGSGETGIAIARAYGLVWADIVTLNALQPPYMLQVGQNLLLRSDLSNIPKATDISPETYAAAFTLNIDDIVTGGQPARSAAPALAVPESFSGRFMWPVQGRIVRRFGSQGGGRVNDGLNISALNGAPVRAAASGIVVYSGNEIGVFGGLVLIDHGGGWITAYGHLGEIIVAKGEQVLAGQTLGGVGETGYVNQPQLHFEIRKDRKPLNPSTLLPPEHG
jgi:murein DD-endopeptidase MepM/ murein hydrolase activator NlpD